MNKVIITRCFECSNWCPANTHGTGVYCDDLCETLSENDTDFPIPDFCPKLKSDTNNKPYIPDKGCVCGNDESFYASSAGCPVHGVHRYGDKS